MHITRTVDFAEPMLGKYKPTTGTNNDSGNAEVMKVMESRGTEMKRTVG